jgi:hypothetical protein
VVVAVPEQVGNEQVVQLFEYASLDQVDIPSADEVVLEIVRALVGPVPDLILEAPFDLS